MRQETVKQMRVPVRSIMSDNELAYLIRRAREEHPEEFQE